MKVIRFLGLIFFVSTYAFANDLGPNWLSKYLKSKSIKCALTREQLREQVKTHVDRNLEKLNESLKARGSEFQTIAENRDQVEIGIFPGTPDFDFYVMENLSVAFGDAGQFKLRVQTTYFTDHTAPTVQNGLWFPLTVKNRDNKQETCQLGRLTLSEGDRRFFPSVDLVIGEPGRVIAGRLIEVVDVAEDNKPKTSRPQKVEPQPESQVAPKALAPAPVTSAPEPSNAPAEKSRAKNSDDEEKKEVKPSRRSRYERRREYRSHRRSSRRRYYRRRSIEQETPAPQTVETPKEDCSGWRAALCKIQGK